MRKFTVILSLAALLAIPQYGYSQSPLFQTHKQQRRLIEELQGRVDSLQKAYDSLYSEHQTLLEPVTSGDGDDIVNEDIAVSDSSPECIDSLLNIYYIQKQMNTDEFDFESMERDSLTSNVPDEVYIERLQRLNSFIPIEFNKYVKNSIIRYTNLASTPRIISLSKFYFPMIESILNEYNLPQELKAMAVIESAFNPRAVSRARAKGMWQFMYTTAKRYGLEMDSYVDERYDPEAACRAAAQYLKDAYDIFGDWSLAIASYNCGEGNVRKAIRRSGGKTNYWDIYNYLPRETRGYIPVFIAALYILQYYPDHYIVPAQISLPAHVDTFHIDRNLHFSQISEVIGIPMEQIRDLNPKYLHDIIPGKSHEYVLNLPFQYSSLFVDKQEEIYAYKDTVFFNPVSIKKIEQGTSDDGQQIVHKVRSGETLGGIAKRYHVTVSQIKNWNGLRSNTIRVGQKLRIYGKGSAPKAQSASSSAKTATGSANGYATYKVRKGDTLYEIARANGVSVSTLYELNNLNKYSKIYPGMVIRVKKEQ
ncbi:MAG: LysM peptidoglycan-binding domain-containing protein [Bacteroidales bacterium]|nr:LysM peptidoglycan-binding domain-containing protein [Candidatus Cacconaster merdequi]